MKGATRPSDGWPWTPVKKKLAVSDADIHRLHDRAQRELADGGSNATGFMISLDVDPATAKQMAIPGGERPEDLHCTLVYLGEAADYAPDEVLTVKRVCAAVVNKYLPIETRVSGVGRFSIPDGDAVYASVDGVPLPNLYVDLLDALEIAGLPVERKHGLSPHITLQYLDHDGEHPLEHVAAFPLTFTHLSVHCGEDVTRFPFIAPAQLSDWAPPRPLNAVEARAGEQHFADIAKTLDTREADFKRALAPVVAKQKAELARQLDHIAASGDVKQLSALKVPFMDEYQKAVAASILAAAVDGWQQVHVETGGGTEQPPMALSVVAEVRAQAIADKYAADLKARITAAVLDKTGVGGK